ncbi:hypothetical protein M0657_011535 [Pyricularia oryzae]|nr:hypothetical protein M9X92_011971 [Pyricularia oryzae]KAI7910083.1 hypothetical protein M0657_011535 [Pyricularia oryzae]
MKLFIILFVTMTTNVLMTGAAKVPKVDACTPIKQNCIKQCGGKTPVCETKYSATPTNLTSLFFCLSRQPASNERSIVLYHSSNALLLGIPHSTFRGITNRMAKRRGHTFMLAHHKDYKFTLLKGYLKV